MLLDLTGILLTSFLTLFSLLMGLVKANSILVLILDKLLDEILDNDAYLFISEHKKYNPENP